MCLCMMYCKRDASARYSALQDPHPSSPKFNKDLGWQVNLSS
jgi:hypothetical protein